MHQQYKALTLQVSGAIYGNQIWSSLCLILYLHLVLLGQKQTHYWLQRRYVFFQSLYDINDIQHGLSIKQLYT